MQLLERLDFIAKSVTAKKAKAEMQVARQEVEALQSELTDQQALVWFRPQSATPEQHEIVVIACEVESDGKRHQILQTAVYEVVEENGEKHEYWNCGMVFVALIFWLRLPAVPKETILLPKKKGGFIL